MVDKQALTEIIRNAINEVFDTMIFMDAIILPDESPGVSDEGIFASIAFRGNLQGRLTFHVSEECSQVITKNMQGLMSEDKIPLEEAGDAMGEVVNMIMGRVKSGISKHYPDIKVSVPSVVIGQEKKSTLSDQAEQVFARIYLDDQYDGDVCFLYREV